nr:atherin-like [Aegilops tauschii subsp. strangulata]
MVVEKFPSVQQVLTDDFTLPVKFGIAVKNNGESCPAPTTPLGCPSSRPVDVVAAPVAAPCPVAARAPCRHHPAPPRRRRSAPPRAVAVPMPSPSPPCAAPTPSPPGVALTPSPPRGAAAPMPSPRRPTVSFMRASFEGLITGPVKG